MNNTANSQTPPPPFYPQLIFQTRSVDVPLTAVHYALKAGNAEVLKSLLEVWNELADLGAKQESNPPSLLRDTSDAQ